MPGQAGRDQKQRSLPTTQELLLGIHQEILKTQQVPLPQTESLQLTRPDRCPRMFGDSASDLHCSCAIRMAWRFVQIPATFSIKAIAFECYWRQTQMVIFTSSIRQMMVHRSCYIQIPNWMRQVTTSMVTFRLRSPPALVLRNEYAGWRFMKTRATSDCFSFLPGSHLKGYHSRMI